MAWHRVSRLALAADVLLVAVAALYAWLVDRAGDGALDAGRSLLAHALLGGEPENGGRRQEEQARDADDALGRARGRARPAPRRAPAFRAVLLLR